jgi:hypothetical protein
VRADLLALSEDSLAALANRGIVRRALREVAEGVGPRIEVDADDRVIGIYPDGVTTTLAPSTVLEAAICSCLASGVCRHKVGVVLAYQQRQAATSVAAFESWSPAMFTDEELDAVLGARVMGAARQAYGRGFRAKVRRPNATDPVPTVELGSCTVRFLVPRELAYAHTDAIRGRRDDAVALAVWAFRAADNIDEAVEGLELEVGGESVADQPQGAASSGVEPAIAPGSPL